MAILNYTDSQGNITGNNYVGGLIGHNDLSMVATRGSMV
jgi:hypothetical protein